MWWCDLRQKIAVICANWGESDMDIMQALARLAEKRPIFFSEADFQHALGWQLHLLDPDANIRF
jgi:predicted ATPase